MKLVLSIFLVLSLAGHHVLAEVTTDEKTKISFYKAGQLVSTRNMTKDEAQLFEALEISNQVMAILEKGVGQSTIDKKRLIDVFIGVTDIDENLKRALTRLSLALEFDASVSENESSILETFAENHEVTSLGFKKKLSKDTPFKYDEIRIAGKKRF